MAEETVTLKEHLDALRECDRRFNDERDRRYAEVAVARAEALRIKDEADKTALGLQRDYQTYKDEQANQLREQISSERGSYITRSEFKPVTDFIAAAGGGVKSKDETRLNNGQVLAFVVMLILVASLIFSIIHG